MKRFLGFVLALVASSSLLLGCGGSSVVTLDREVTKGPLTYSVSSQWMEQGDSDDHSGGGYYDYGDGEHVEVYYFDYSERTYGPESFEEYASWHEDNLGEVFTVTAESVIDGAAATRYTYTRNTGGEEATIYCVYMVRGQIMVGIDGTDEAVVDAIVDSIHLAG